MKITPLFAVGVALGAIAGCRADETRDRAAGKPVEGRAVTAPRVTSKDGTAIAFDRTGKGPPLIIVSGALSHRAALAGSPLVARLADRYTVYVYDRRGRGDSTDVQPYAVEREVEDLDALVAHAGGSAYVFGVSSGAALALYGAAALGPTRITKLALYEPPYGQEPSTFATQKRRVTNLVAHGRPGDAATYFFGAIGMPPAAIAELKRSPEWKTTAAIDFTLAYDYAVLGDGAVPESIARAITVPTLILDGEKTMPFIHPAADHLATLMPSARRQTLAGQTHQVDADATVPALVAFF